MKELYYLVTDGGQLGADEIKDNKGLYYIGVDRREGCASQLRITMFDHFAGFDVNPRGSWAEVYLGFSDAYKLGKKLIELSGVKEQENQ